MPTYTIEANGTLYDKGAWGIGAGSGFKWAIVSDDTDSTYLVGGFGPSEGQSWIAFNMNTFTLPVGEYVRGAQVRFRAQQFSPFPEVPVFLQTFVRVGPIGDPGDGPADQWGVLYAGAFIEFTGMLHARQPNGQPWDQAAVDNVNPMFYMKTGSNLQYDLVKLSQVWVDFITNTPPTTNVTAPSGTVTTSQRAPIVFDYDDDDLDQMDAYNLRIFTATQYGIGGFDPATSPCFYDAGTVYQKATPGSSVSASLPTQANARQGIPPRMHFEQGTTYRAYVRVRQQLDSYWSDWDYSQFTINCVLPNAPTLTALAQDSNWRIKLTLTHNASNVCSGFIERSDDGGTTWKLIRMPDFGYLHNLNFSDVRTVYDYEAPPGVAVLYRATVVDANFIWSNITTIGSPVTSNPVTAKGWILKELSDAGNNNMELDVYSAGWETEQKEEQAVYNPLGRRLPVVISDVVHGKDGTLQLESSVADADYFEALRNMQQVLLMQRVYADVAEQKYIRLGSPLKRTENNTDPVIVSTEIPYVEVEMPNTEDFAF